MRLQKYLAQSGVASRRASEKLIAEGFDEVLMPGEFEHKHAEKLEKEGIEIPDNTWNGLVSIAQELGCSWSRDLSAGESKVGFVHF